MLAASLIVLLSIVDKLKVRFTGELIDRASMDRVKSIQKTFLMV